MPLTSKPYSASLKKKSRVTLTDSFLIQKGDYYILSRFHVLGQLADELEEMSSDIRRTAALHQLTAEEKKITFYRHNSFKAFSGDSLTTCLVSETVLVPTLPKGM